MDETLLKNNSKWKIAAKAIFIILIAAYFVSCAANRSGYYFFDSVDLAIHEAGHVFFFPFGEFLQFAGGTIFQLSVPLVFVIYFWKRKELYSASIVSFWLGQSFTNAGRYAGDAIKMELPLVGGGIHDWNYLLSRIGALPYTEQIGNTFYYLGVAIIAASIIVGILSFAKSSTGKNKNY